MTQNPFNIPPRYRKISNRKHGGIGFTETLFDEYLQRRVILKRITDISSTKRLLDEISALQSAKSDHVVQIYDVLYGATSETKEIPYGIIEEYLDGEDISNFHTYNHDIKTTTLTLFQIACGIFDLHRCKIIHRDIKPNNIKYDKEKNPKIFDFNLAKSGPAPHSTIGLIGTPGFMAPELYAPKPDITTKVDVYAFGILAHQMLTGKLPSFAGQIDKQPSKPHASESIENLAKLHPNVAKVLDSCLEIDPHRRPDFGGIVHTLRKEILRDTHKGKMISGGYEHELSKDKPDVTIKRKNGDDAITITYHGTHFTVSNATGNVFINNSPAQIKQELTGSYVIILGDRSLKNKRAFITFDITNEDYAL